MKHSSAPPHMHIGLVAGSLNGQHVRGMGKYLLEMTAQSRVEEGLRWTFFGEDSRYPMRMPSGIDCQADVFELRGHRLRLWEQLGVPLRARRRKVDLIHYAENTAALWQPLPSVVTVHDTLPWETGTPSFYWDRCLPAALSRCAAVITISESSRRDILRLWPHLEHKLSVIPHGISAAYLEPRTASDEGPFLQSLKRKPYLVYLGGPMARKRFDWAVEVLGRCGLEDLELVVCGFSSASHAGAREKLPRHLQSRVHFAPYLEDEELQALYQGAVAVLYPTLYEGFGFPAIEAQASGVPALFSPLGSLAELVGPLAWTLDAEDMDAWVAKVREARAMPPDVRQSLGQDAREWARRFDWRVSHEAHVKVYRQVLGQPAMG